MLTTRAARWSTLQVGRHGRAVTEVAGDLGCGWHTVMDAVVAVGEQLIDHPSRIGEVSALGLDETLFARVGRFRHQLWSAGTWSMRCSRNWDDAAGAGLDRGAYHFFTLCRPGGEQAENLLGALPADPDALPPVVDLELAGNCSERPDRAWVERELGAFLAQVENATGQTVAVYMGDDFEGRYHIRDQLDRPIWHRRVLIRPDVEGWWIWQVQGYAAVDGIDGDVDLNVMRGEHPEVVPSGRGT